MNATPATSAPGANATPLLASTHTTLWLRAGLRAGASGGRSALDHGARLRAVLDLLEAPGAHVADRLAGVEALAGMALKLGADGRLQVRIVVEGHDSAALNGLVSGLGPLLDLLALHVEGIPLARGADAFDYLHQLVALHAAQDDGSAGVFLPDFSWSRSDPPAGGAATGRSDAAALMEAGARWHALEAEFARGDEAAVFQQAAAHVLASGPQARTAIAGALENAAHAAWADVAGWLHKAGQAVADTAGPAGPQTHVAATKAQWRRVMIDEKARYSVCGYQPRMERSIGLIYLGMDESDPRYAPWSGPANAAAATIPESEGFERALRLTRSALQAAGGCMAIKPLTDQVLARLCTEWFGIPDGVHMRIDGSFLPLQPPGCPGQFSPPSGFIAEPDPGLPTRVLGEMDGHLIIDGALGYIRAMRQQGKVPEGSLGAALFAQFPEPAQDVQLARTLIGLMMGFLPPAQINLIHFFEVLKGDTMTGLQQQYCADTEPDLYKRADRILRVPMMAAMQQNPMPPQMWRTAVAADQWPGSPPVEVKPGDRVILDVLKVTQADLAAGVHDVSPIFGGNRDQSPFPTHACPGTWAGMGVFLGILAGTLLDARNVNDTA